MQKFEILFSLPISGGTELPGENSGLQINNGYFAYNQSGLGGGMVTEFNIRQFLENPQNGSVSTAFFAYLTGNTSTSELKEIDESDVKLSSVFNQFYNTTILSGNSSPTSFIDQQLTGTTEITVTRYFHEFLGSDFSGNKNIGAPKSISGSNLIGVDSVEIDSFTNEVSYFLPISLNRKSVDIARINFSEFTQDCFREVTDASGNTENKFLAQCFVDLNKVFDPNSPWVTPEKNSVSFERLEHFVDEPSEPGRQNTVQVRVVLDRPSEFGTEFVSVFFSEPNSNANTDDFKLFVDGVEYDTQVPLQFNIGEQEKIIDVSVFGDLNVEGTEYINFGFTNYFNLNSGGLEQTYVFIGDSTVLLDASFDGLDTKFVGEKFVSNLNGRQTLDLTAWIDPLAAKTPPSPSLGRGSFKYATYNRLDFTETDAFGYSPDLNFDDSTNEYVVPRDMKAKFKSSVKLIWKPGAFKTQANNYNMRIKLVRDGVESILYQNVVSIAIPSSGNMSITTPDRLNLLEGDRVFVDIALIKAINTFSPTVGGLGGFDQEVITIPREDAGDFGINLPTRSPATTVSAVLHTSNQEVEALNGFEIFDIEDGEIVIGDQKYVMDLSEQRVKTVEVSLDRPSLFGVERAEVEFIPPTELQSGSFTGILRIDNGSIEWAIGEQTKQVEVEFFGGPTQAAIIQTGLPLAGSVRVKNLENVEPGSITISGFDII